jgi:MtrB/PioB family decaheme-associated outer membrane protein
MNRTIRKAFPLSVLAEAMLVAVAPVQAAEVDELAEIGKPESSISVGVGYVSDDNRRFGQYTGLHDDGFYGLLDLDYVRRDDGTGTWVEFSGRNLGLDSREVRFEHERQGDWEYFIEYNQIPRMEFYTVNTLLQGIGTNQLTRVDALTEGNGVNYDFGTMRKAVTLGGQKKLPAGFDFKVSFRNEEKTGERLFGSSGWAPLTGINFLAEPIDSTTRQWETVLSFARDKLQWAAGYYGTSYDNRYQSIIVDGVLDGSNAQFSPIGLPPDNQSHQLYFSGGYSFTPTTRGNFKLAYARQTQDDTFIPVTVAPGIGTHLGGEIETKQAQLGFTARPMPKLSLLANFRYEDRDDQTPVLNYLSTAAPTATNNGDNEPYSIETAAGKLEANYQMPMGFRLSGGIDYGETERSVSAVRSVSARRQTDETAYRVELRRSLSETVNGALSYIHSVRDGTDFLVTTLNNGTLGSNQIAPIFLADRDRDKVRLTLDWAPSEPLSIQLVADTAWDDYEARTDLNLGPREGDWQHLSVDATYVLSPTMQFTAFASYDATSQDQVTCNGISADFLSCANIWSAKLENVGKAFGIGMRGKPTDKLEMGVDLTHSRDEGKFITRQTLTTVLPQLPDVNYKLTSVKLFGKYALQKNSGVRVDLVHERWETDEWSWANSPTVNLLYSDNTAVFQDTSQSVSFVGLSYFYSWR